MGFRGFGLRVSCCLFGYSDMYTVEGLGYRVQGYVLGRGLRSLGFTRITGFGVS